MDRDLPKVLNLTDLVLFTVSAIVLLDTLAASASIGPSSLFWWLFLGGIFLHPMGLMTAELGTMYPAEDGIYVWIRKAFGKRWAARAVWATTTKEDVGEKECVIDPRAVGRKAELRKRRGTTRSAPSLFQVCASSPPRRR